MGIRSQLAKGAASKLAHKLYYKPSVFMDRGLIHLARLMAINLLWFSLLLSPWPHPARQDVLWMRH
jgi:hypothetical protein